MKKLAAVGAALILGVGAFAAYTHFIANPAVVRELRTNPGGERAKKVMLLTLPSGKERPVNYLREGDFVYAGADGVWWKELRGTGRDVELFVQGENLHGRARAIENDPGYTLEIFKRLRPTSYEYLGGVLVEIRIEGR